jgi:hypothetical protein
MGEKRAAYRSLVTKPDERRQLDRPRHRWQDNTKTDLRDIGWGAGGIDWINLSQDRNRWRAPVNMVMNLWVA